MSRTKHEYWQCKSCDLYNNPSSSLCQACFTRNLTSTQATLIRKHKNELHDKQINKDDDNNTKKCEDSNIVTKSSEDEEFAKYFDVRRINVSDAKFLHEKMHEIWPESEVKVRPFVSWYEKNLSPKNADSDFKTYGGYICIEKSTKQRAGFVTFMIDHPYENTPPIESDYLSKNNFGKWDIITAWDVSYLPSYLQKKHLNNYENCKFVHIVELIVDTKYRQKGIATQLIKNLQKDNDLPPLICCEVEGEKEQLRTKFYEEKLGFKVVKYLDVFYYGPGWCLLWNRCENQDKKNHNDNNNDDINNDNDTANNGIKK